ncbi:uncharacterized protein LOC144913612 [Branchiostoma floridae x Branchiostoma belcheri]
MLRPVLLVFAVLFSTAAAEYCTEYGFHCPRKTLGFWNNDDDNQVYCCKKTRECCKDCWDAIDTSDCTNILDSVIGLGTAVIVGIIVAVIAVVIVVVVICVCCCCQCAKQTRSQGQVYQPPNQGQQMAMTAQPGQYPTAPQAQPYPPPDGSQYPPPAGQYPPPGGEYPPPGQYPPPGGEYPPPAGQYPPPGGEYPPPGQYPPPAGQYPPGAGQYPPPAYPVGPLAYPQDAAYPQKM